MSLFSMLGRLAVFTLAAALPFAAVGATLAGLRGLVAAEALFLWVAVVACLRAEHGILAIYRVRKDSPDGVRRSLDRVLAGLGGRSPRVLIFSDPAPQALAVRSLGSRGAILLSEGLLGSVTEDELRQLLRLGVLRIRSRGIAFQTFCAWLAHLTLELAPRAWVELLFGELRWHENLGAFSALRFAAVFSAARFFVRLGRVSGVDAPRALTRLPSASGEVVNPGSCILHFSDPWAQRSLFDL